MQWGNITAQGSSTFNYPISFSTLYMHNISFTQSSPKWMDWPGCTSTVSTVTYPEALKSGHKLSIIAVGKQQWRFNYTPANSWEVWTFPIPFSGTTYFCYCCMQYADVSGKGWGHIYNKTALGCNLIMDRTTNDCFAIGKQQWRYLEALSSKNTWTYPIAFLNFVIPITTRHYDNADEQSTQEMAVTERSLTFCKILCGSSYTKGIFCYAVGVQQWGYGNDLTENTTIYFPVAFTNVPFSIINIGFYIANSGRQIVREITSAYFVTHSELRTSATNSYLAIGC